MAKAARGTLLLVLSLAALSIAACSTPRFDMVGEEATGDPIANKRVGQEPRTQ